MPMARRGGSPQVPGMGCQIPWAGADLPAATDPLAPRDPQHAAASRMLLALARLQTATKSTAGPPCAVAPQNGPRPARAGHIRRPLDAALPRRTRPPCEAPPAGG